jgi:hypothetical protein
LINAAEFVNLAAAIAALPLDGGTVYLPTNHDSMGRVVPYTVASTVIVDRPVRFLGDGPGGTLIIAATPNPSYPLFDVRSSFVQFENLTISGRATAPSSADCIQINGLGVSGRLVQHVVLRDCEVVNAGRNGLRSLDAIVFEADNCSFVRSQSDGVFIDMGADRKSSTTTTMRFMNCSMSYNRGRGVFLPRNGVGITFFGCVFEGNAGGHGPDDGSGLAAIGIFRLELYSCYFEVPDTTGINPGQYLYFKGSPSVLVDGCVFSGHASLDRAAKFVNCPGARFSNNVAEKDSAEIVLFDSECAGAIEFGNRDLDMRAGHVPRINIQGRGTTSLSSGTLNLGRFYKDNLPLPGTRPGNVLPGSVAWIEDAAKDSAQSHLQISNGTAWQSIPIGSSRRSVFLPSSIMRVRAGTGTVGDAGTYPSRFSYVSWPGDATGTNAVGIETMVPADYLPDSPDSLLSFRIVWSHDDVSTSGRHWVCELNFLSPAERDRLDGPGRTLVDPIDVDRGPVNGTFYDTIGTGRAGRPGQILRINVGRRAQDRADDYDGTIRFVGLVLEYSGH